MQFGQTHRTKWGNQNFNPVHLTREFSSHYTMSLYTIYYILTIYYTIYYTLTIYYTSSLNVSACLLCYFYVQFLFPLPPAFYAQLLFSAHFLTSTQ